MVMEVVHEDMGEGNMQCTNHPHMNMSSPAGGICAFCLQEKLGKLVSSSFPVPIFPSSSSSLSPSSGSGPTSIRSDSVSLAPGASSTAIQQTTLQKKEMNQPQPSLSLLLTNRVALNTPVAVCPTARGNDCSYSGSYTARRAKLPFVSTHKNKKKKEITSDSTNNIVFKRSKSTATRGTNFLNDDDFTNSPHRRGSFWSFLYLSSKHSTLNKNRDRDLSFPQDTPSSVHGAGGPNKKTEDLSPDDQTSFDRKVSRSRSVGCGSRSFSGDFFERISTGFGDCTLRRVESQREGGPGGRGKINGQDCIKERVKCGGIFSGFAITSSSSSSSSSYWVDNNVGSGKQISAYGKQISAHGRSKSWGWAFASPMRAFSKPAKRDKNVTPNLAAIPSLLAVSS